MKKKDYEEVWYSASAYVWCKGISPECNRHPIFVSSPVKFTQKTEGRSTFLTCREKDCSCCGRAVRYEEKEIGFQEGYTPAMPAA